VLVALVLRFAHWIPLEPTRVRHSLQFSNSNSAEPLPQVRECARRTVPAKDREGIEQQIKGYTARASRHSKALGMANMPLRNFTEKWQGPLFVNSLKKKENLAPRARFELATLRLTAECSTIELPGNIPIF
jgi:hypothetical protein